MREYAYAEKAEFVNKMQKELSTFRESWIGLAPRSTEQWRRKGGREGQARDGAREMDPDQAAT